MPWDSHFGPDEHRPWWDKALDPLRHEQAMFRLLLVVAAAALVLIGVVTLVRAV